MENGLLHTIVIDMNITKSYSSFYIYQSLNPLQIFTEFFATA